MKIAVIGAYGQLGYDLGRVIQSEGDDLIEIGRSQADVADLDAVRVAVAGADAIINTAAFHNVPVCEQDPKTSLMVNGNGAANAAVAASELGVPVMYISTDYVFDGAKGSPYLETDRENPLNVYGSSKLAGEQLTQILADRHFVVRSTGLYGSKVSSKGHTFPKKMLQLAHDKPQVSVVNDQFCTPTYTLHLAKQLIALLKTDNYGLFHATSEGSCSWYDFTRHVFDLAGVQTPLLPVSSDSFPSPVKRPSYSVLENAHLKRIGLNIMAPWEEAIESYLKEEGVI